MKLIYKELKEDDLSQLAELSKAEYGDDHFAASEVYLRWKHLQNPQGVSQFYLLYDEDKVLIGKIGIQARKFESQGGKTVLGGYLVDLVIHPRYRGIRTFLKLTEKLKIDESFDFIYLTPNASSTMLYEKLLKIPILFHLAVYAAPVNLCKIIEFVFKRRIRVFETLFFLITGFIIKLFELFCTGVNIRLLQTVEKENAGFDCRDLKAKGLWVGARDRDFFAWRFSKIENQKYERFNIEQNGRSCGYCWIRVQKYLGLNCLFLLDIGLEADLKFRETVKLYLELVKLARRSNCDLVFKFENATAESKGTFSQVPLLKVPERFLPQPVPLFYWSRNDLDIKNSNFFILSADLDVF
jgi:hypothetical protein